MIDTRRTVARSDFAIKMDSEGSSPSDESQSSSESSDEASSGQDEERLEPATILGTAFEFPQDLCEDPEIFKEFLSMKTWESLSENETEHLKRFLPNFEENDAEEKNVTIEKLFARETFNFTSPLVEFHQKLRDGAFRPDIARMHKVLQKARQQHSRHQWRAECYKTVQEVLVCRERLLALAHASAPGSHLPHASARPTNQNLQAPSAPSLHLRAKRRYFQELAAIRSEVCGGDGDAQPSEDENFPDGPPPPHSNAKQHRRQNSHSQIGAASVGGLNGNFPPLTEEWRRRALAAHRLRKVNQPDHPELNTAGITLGCVRGRCRGVSAAPAEGGGRARRPPRSRAPPPPPVPAAPSVHARILSPHPQSNMQHHPDSPSDEETFVPTPPAPPPPPRLAEPPPLIVRAPPPPQPAPPPPPQEPALGEDLGVELVQATHACFLSVVRDLVCGTPRHCLPLPQLAARLRRWRQNPIAPLNHWYSGAEDWVKALPSAVAFLAGEGEGAPSPDDFVPYLQYKPATQVYQWIGAGRDSDALLSPLCATWLARRQAAKPVPRTTHSLPAPAPPPLATPQRLTSLSQPDRWQKDEGMELESFRSQERARFQRPHRAFTYRLAEAMAVVGPLKGVYACEENGGGRGARGHSLLASARPRHVTLLALVRDAVACLPDGEGTRAHITALLRRSQYLVSDAGEQALQAAVSGALDRMHCAPDPCVRYLPARKLWLYLHRDRTEEEFERLHAEVQGKTAPKGKGGAAAGGGGGSRRAGGTRAVAAPEVVAPPPTPPRAPTASPRRRPVPSPSRSISVNVSPADDEDANVDVEGTEPPLSPAPSLSPPPPPISPPARIDATSAAVSSISGISYQRVVPVSVSVSSEKISNMSATVNVVTAPVAAAPPPPVVIPVSAPIVASLASVRQPQMAAARSMVRVLSPATPGKSLISPRALRPSTPPPSSPRGGGVVTTQAKVVVQRSATQPHTTGALPLSHQRILLESLMQHQRTHGQPMSHDQLLHTIHSTQKLSSSPPVTPGGVATAPKPQQTIHLAGQTVQLASGQTVQLTGQTVQLTGQTVRLTGQTVQLGGQTVRLADPSLRPQKQPGPLVAKILTNAQTSASSLVGSNMTDGVGTTATLSQPQPHHTLLLSNLGGQVVRVASGGGALLGPALRLQAASPATHHLTQARATGVAGASVLLGGQTLKLQAAPVRLHHQNVTASVGGVSATMTGGRVVLAGGARLHGLKLLPMHHTIRGVGAGRQVYARIVTPASAPRPLPPPVQPNDPSGNAAPPTIPRTQ